MPCSEKIVWSDERQKWLCYDDATIDLVMNSDSFSVPSYDYSDLETKFDKNFTHTKQVIRHFPLANEGQAHLDLRARMIKDVQDNLKRALQIFKLSLEEKMADLAKSKGPIDIAPPIIGAILESNWAFANIQSDQKIDYSDLTLMLDDSQSIKKRVLREEFIRSLMPLTGEKDHAYKLALISVGVDALIGTTLHSIIKVLSNHDYQTLIQRKHFHSNGIKHLERVCVQDALVSGQAIHAGQRLRLYVEAYEQAGLSDVQMNKKFFAADSPHACIGFSYSLSIWKELMTILKNNFSDLRLLGFDYRANDAIFNFPTHIRLEYTP